MLKKLVSSLSLATLLFSATTQALPIVQADAFTAGDNKAVLETDTGLVWMDFGVNSHLSFDHVQYLLPTQFAGWRLPTAAEVDHLWTGLFGDFPEWHRWDQGIGFLSSMSIDEYLNSIFAVFGNSLDSTTFVKGEFGDVIESWTSKSILGVFMKEPGVSGFVSINMPYDDIHYRDAMYLEMSGTDVSGWFGTLLVKDTTSTVPEPTSITLLLIAAAALVARNRRRI